MDDASLAMNIIQRNVLGLFQTLDYFQKAPPFFMVFTWVIYHTFGISEFSFRFIPFVSSIAAIFLFFKVAEKYLNNKISVIFALFLFVVNSKLIYYAQAFKQYSSDVLIILLLLYFYTMLNSFCTEERKKHVFVLIGLIIGFLTLFSYPVLFVFPIIILLALLNNFNKKTFINLCIMSIPFALVCFYYIFQAFGADSTQKELINMWNNIEVCGFFSADMQSNCLTIKKNILYLFDLYNFKFILLSIFSGSVFFFFSNKKKFYLIFGVILLTVFASIMKLYPFSERTIMFLLPLIILLVAKNLDYFSPKKIVTYLIPIMLAFSFVGYDFNYVKNMFCMKINIPIYPEDKNIREMYKYICENKDDNDFFVYFQHESISNYYLRYYAKENSNILSPEIEISDDKIKKEEYFAWLNSCEKGRTYWLFTFYLPYLNQIDSYTKEYLTKNNLPFETKDLGENYKFYKFTL